MAKKDVALRGFGTLLEKKRDSLQSHAINGVSVDRIISGAKLAAAANPALLECSPESVMMAVYQAARLGLELGGPMGRAYLVPYKRQAQLIVGYKGMIELALRSGRIRSIVARVVRVEDDFHLVQGTEEQIIHKPYFPVELAGEVVAVYAVAQLEGGGSVFEWMTTAQVEVIREGRGGPWESDWEQMAKKTIIRRLANYLPMTPELAATMALVDRELAPEAGSTGAEILSVPELEVEAEVLEEAVAS